MNLLLLDSPCTISLPNFDDVSLFLSSISYNLDSSRPGVGKTTVMREIAHVLSDEFHKRVVN
jgi:hypothetical protein